MQMLETKSTNTESSDNISSNELSNDGVSEMTPESWLDNYGNILYRYAFMHLRDQQSAEDAVQDTLLSAYKAREQFQGRSTVKTWLMTIIRNKVIDIVRKNKRDSLVLMESVEDDPTVKSYFGSFGVWSKWLNSWGSNPDKIYEQKDFLRQLNSCLENLPENLRQVFIFKNVDNLSTEEICSKLSINPNNVWVILYRARIKLRDCLDNNWFNANK